MTSNPAEIFGTAARNGTIARGRPADLVLWSGDPLEVTTLAERVVHRGPITADGVPPDAVARPVSRETPGPLRSMKTYKYYDLILGAYVCVLLCANLIGPCEGVHGASPRHRGRHLRSRCVVFPVLVLLRRYLDGSLRLRA